MIPPPEEMLASLLLSIDGWVAHLEEIRRQGCQQKDLDHFQATLCQASHSLRQLIARRAGPVDTTSTGPNGL